MKKILLLSDTHSYIDDKILDRASKSDEVWHAGDIGSIEVTDQLAERSTLRAVYGNIDDATLRKEFPENLVFQCEKVKVLMTHIGGYPGRYPARVKSLITAHQPQLFVCGHSHILKVMYDEKYAMLCMNPGACGNKGFHKVRTVLQFELEGEEIKNLEVIEWKR